MALHPHSGSQGLFLRVQPAAGRDLKAGVRKVPRAGPACTQMVWDMLGGHASLPSCVAPSPANMQ